MAALNYAHTTRTPLRTLTALVGAVCNWIIHKHEDARTRRMLLSLTDRELADIGLSRCEVERIAQNGRPH